MTMCDVPPPGWWCSREPGHDGPCAARPLETEGDGDYCFHSMTRPDCLPCWKGIVSRQNTHIDRLRQMLVDAGQGDALTEHDAHWFGGNARPLPERSESYQTRTFPRFKYAEEFAYDIYCDGKKFNMTVKFDVSHIEPGEEDEPYVYDEFVVEWRD